LIRKGKKGAANFVSCTLFDFSCFRLGKTLLKAGAFASSLAQEVQPGAADLAVTLNDYLINPRRAGKEGSFNADTVAGYAANGKGGIRSIIAIVKNGTLELLDALAVSFFNLYMHANNVTSPQGRDIRIYRRLEGFQYFSHLNIPYQLV
jgi:hypothetical protein